MRSAPTCVVSWGHDSIATVPPATIAAMRKGAAFDRSGSMSTSRAAMGPGATTQTPSSGLETVTPRASRAAIVISMCGIDGRRSPVCRRVSPSAKRGAASRRPETNWLDALASIATSPPRTAPEPHRLKGRAPRPSSLTSTPSARSESIVVRMGRRRAASSPSKATGPRASAATGGRKRMTVPASPTSMLVEPVSSAAGVTRRSGPYAPSPGTSSTPTPSARSAAIMSAESRECRGRRSSDGPSASAARTSSRLVRLFDPGRARRASSGPVARGARHGPSSPVEAE